MRDGWRAVHSTTTISEPAGQLYRSNSKTTVTWFVTVAIDSTFALGLVAAPAPPVARAMSAKARRQSPAFIARLPSVVGDASSADASSFDNEGVVPRQSR